MTNQYQFGRQHSSPKFQESQYFLSQQLLMFQKTGKLPLWVQREEFLESTM